MFSNNIPFRKVRHFGYRASFSITMVTYFLEVCIHDGSVTNNGSDDGCHGGGNANVVMIMW